MRVQIAAFPNTGNEPEAIRQVLESFGCTVLTKYIGRPNDFIDFISGTDCFDPDVVILSGHGENETFIMPVLCDSVYTEGEPKYNFSSAEINQHLKLSGKTIVSTCCTTGYENLATVFSKENIYIAPAGYIEGNAVLLFLVDFFYQLIQKHKTVEYAWHHAHSLDDETAIFAFYKNLN